MRSTASSGAHSVWSDERIEMTRASVIGCIALIVALLPAGAALGKPAQSAFNATPREGELWLYNKYWTLADVECIGAGGAVLPGRFPKLACVARDTRAVTQALLLRPIGYRKFSMKYIWRYG
jgi:hypothetical protein